MNYNRELAAKLRTVPSMGLSDEYRCAIADAADQLDLIARNEEIEEAGLEEPEC